MLKFNFMIKLCILINMMFLSTYALKCYSCSTKNGDTYCAEDVFDGKKVKLMECPNDADVCVRLRQTKDGSIFRSCGTSQSAMNPEKTNFGYVPIKNTCITYNSIKESLFPDVE